MRKFLLVTLSILLLLTLIGCETGNNGDSNEDKSKSNDELYLKAMDVLDEFNGDQRIKDFRNAYDLLMTLPSNEDDFISQLSEANKIYERYDVAFGGDYYLRPKHTIGIDQEGINKYRAQSAYYDANDLMNAIVYPVLFEKYGNEARSIDGITADNIITAIKSTGNYILDKKTEQYDGCKEEWKYVGVPKTNYEIKYHSNGLVENIVIPIVRSDNPLSDDEYIAFFDKDATTQKQIAGERFMSMSNQFSTIFTGYEVLSQIFTDEEIAIISNYIHSLTIKEIWERNLYALSNEPSDYFGAIVVFEYKNNSISISYGLNDISLNISSKKIINPLSTRWYTLWCGMCLPEGERKEETIATYKDVIENNIESNGTIPEWAFDLDANVAKYQTPSNNTTVPPAEAGEANTNPFFKHNHFVSNNNNEIFIVYQDDNYIFYVNDSLIGYSNTWVETPYSNLFEIDVDNGTYLIFCYPNDAYISVEVLGFLDPLLNGNYYP